MAKDSKSGETPASHASADRTPEASDGIWSSLRSWLGITAPAAEPRGKAEAPSESAQAEARSMMVNLLEFASMRVDDVMVPRVDIVTIDESASLYSLMQRFAEASHSRLPVYRETLDDLIGMVHIKDLVSLMIKSSAQKKRRRAAKSAEQEASPAPEKVTLKSADLSRTVKQAGIVRDVLFVPPSMPVSDLLVKMQATHLHMAIVVDEYGGTDGLVTIEDLVEVIVGDIADEHDTGEENMIRDLGKGVYVADARVPIEEVESLLGRSLLPEEQQEEADTLGGLIFAMLGRVPVRGELVRHPSGVEFEVAESDPRRVKKIRIHTSSGNGTPAGESGARP